MAVWSASVLSLFVEMLPGPLGHSLAGRALEAGIWTLHNINIRDFAEGGQAQIDAPPFGGGAGMVMRPDIAGRAITHACQAGGVAEGCVRLCPSPRGRPLDQKWAKELAAQKGIMIICPRYEGLDQRVIDKYELTEISIGDYVLSGGEVAAMVIIDTIVRLLPGVVSTAESLQYDSFEEGLLEHDHYTQPRIWQDMAVPEILHSGHHGEIARWRAENAENNTRKRRPDLWANYLATSDKKDA